MTDTQTRRKARLLREAESLIDQLLVWNKSTREPDLTQIEEVVLRLRQRFSEAMAREVIEAQEAKQAAIGPPCPKCGQEMRYKGQKEVRPRTWVGDVQYERGYYHCAECKEGLFPPGRTARAEGQEVQ